MKRLIKRLYLKWRRHKMRKQAQLELSEKMFNDPTVYNQKVREINCIIDGHEWSSDFEPKSEINKTFRKRVYCKKCGVYFHIHRYYPIKTD